MSINKDLNVDPYYDDFDETKQFNRVLFKPARAVQARELTQLQTILQKQVERFGSNVYKEGTVISGINLTSRDDLNYVKLQDQPSFTDPSLYNEYEVDSQPGIKQRFVIVGTDTGLKAEVVKGLGGFETQAPNLKTLFINYVGFSDTATTEQIESGVKQFSKGELLRVYNPDGETSPVQVGGQDLTITTFDSAQSNDHVGKSFAVSCEEGVIYQRGHFIFVDEQLVIVTRYSEIPGQEDLVNNPDVLSKVSVGFTINENIIDSNQDLTLLDNASGFNNNNAPGADRLQLVPTLTTYASSSEPEDFFALIRYVEGKAVRLRDFTEFNKIGDELARRTFESTGNYVVNGLDVSLETDDGTPTASLSQGKAYVFGREIANVTTTKLPITEVTSTQTKQNQTTGVDYGQYYTFNSSSEQSILPLIGHHFTTVDTDNVRLYTVGLYREIATVDTKIGTANVLAVTPGVSGVGRIYVCNVRKAAGYETLPPEEIGLDVGPSNVVSHANYTGNRLVLTNDGLLNDSSNSRMIFDTGKFGTKSLSDTVLVRKRISRNVTLNGAIACDIDADTVNDKSYQPLANGNIFAVEKFTPGQSTTPKIYLPSNVQQNTDPVSGGFSGITVTFQGNIPTDGTIDVHYDATFTGELQDQLTLVDGYVKTSFDLSSNTATLCNPNVLEVEQVLLFNTNNDLSTMTDVTSKFTLVTNQTDEIYDISFIKLKGGETPLTDGQSMVVKLKCLTRDNSEGRGGYLTANSYPDEAKHLIRKYTAKDLNQYDLLSSYDFRKYKNTPTSGTEPAVPQASPGGLSTFLDNTDVANLDVLTSPDGPVSFQSVVNSTLEYYLSRVDTVVIDEYGESLIVTGDEGDFPVPPKLERQYGISNIFVPGNSRTITGENRITLETVSNKTYTMEDIASLDKRVQDLTGLVHLSFAEREAKSLLIRDAEGNERFKNGILVDNFTDLSGAEFNDPQFNASINDSETYSAPALRQYPVDLKLDTSNIVRVSSDATTDDFLDVLTLDAVSTVSVLEQPYGTDFRNCVSNYYNYQGKVDIDPKFSSDQDVTQGPKINLDIDIAGPMLDLVDNLQNFVPLTRARPQDSTTRQTSTFIDRVNRIRRAPVRVRNFVTSTPTDRLVSSTRTTKQDLGNFITDIRMKPYLPSKYIKVFGVGLRPNTRHYVYFDGKDMGNFLESGEPPKSQKVYHKGRKRNRRRNARMQIRNTFSTPKTSRFNKGHGGDAIYTNSRGEFRGIFKLPAKTFFVGENDVELSDAPSYHTIDSAGTSYAKITHRGYNFGITKSSLSATTRTVEFDTDTTVATRSFQTRRRDPIAQTFRLRSSSVTDAKFGYISEIDVFFRRKDTKHGVTLQIRESENGYPSKKVLPFAEKMLSPEDVNVSDDGTVKTTFKFDNPVRLKSDIEYCFVVIPDANSPEYLIWTSKVGNTSSSFGDQVKVVAVTNDWGDGTLFTSTNDSAWKSYQDEDIKFNMKRYDFLNSSLPAEDRLVGTADLIPNDVEFLTIRDNIKETGLSANDARLAKPIPFEADDIVYVLNSSAIIYPMTIGSTSGDQELPTIMTPQNDATVAINEGDYVFIETTDGTESMVARIIDDTDGLFTIDNPFTEAASTEGISVNVKLCVAGIVSHYDERDPTRLHIKESSARLGNFIDDNGTISFGNIQTGVLYTITNIGTTEGHADAWGTVGAGSSAQVGTQFVAGALPENATDFNGQVRPNTQIIRCHTTGAQATISKCKTLDLSYFQAQILTDNTINTTTNFDLMRKNNAAQIVLDKPLSLKSDIYGTNRKRSIVSLSEQLRVATITGQSMLEDFRIRGTLTSRNRSVSPTLDVELSTINAYVYQITNDETGGTTSNYISKEVILTDGIPAEGLKVVLNAFRPAGTIIDVYSRFTRPEFPDVKTDWVKLTQANPDQFSNSSNLQDYRTFEYDLAEPTSDTPKYGTFQIRLVFRHMTENELDTPDLYQITPGASLFPKVFDYRAVALT